MPIPETRNKIHFTAYNPTKGRAPIDKDAPPPTASVSRKYNRITFTKRLIQEAGMAGKFVRLYYDPIRKVIGWRVRASVDQGDMKVWKLCRPNATNGNWGLNIKKMLDDFNGRLKKDTYQALPVQKYREMNPLEEHSGEVFYFVELREEEANN